MIKTDQFANLPNDLLLVFSSRDDGSVLDRTGLMPQEHILSNRKRICEKVGIDYENTVFQKIVYSDDASYNRVLEVDERMTTKHVSSIQADGLITETPGVGLFLPVADCIVTVLYDPVRRILAQLHMGRHSSLTDILQRTVTHFSKKGSQLEDIKVWMAPAATKASYILDYFEPANDSEWKDFVEEKDGGFYVDLQGHNRAELLKAGVPPDNITMSQVDTMQNLNYFSHARGDVAERFAGLAMMR